jgi:kynurenine formamidase
VTNAAGQNAGMRRRRGVLHNVARLDRLPPEGFRIIALPMKIRGGSGGPLRTVAILE